ncbi:MAG: molybdopterin-binding protein [Pirellulaceae bacterium]
MHAINNPGYRLARQSIGWICVAMAMGTCRVPAQEDIKAADDLAVDYSILITGNELLTGVYPDGHTHFLTRTLRPLGMRCVGSMSVDDEAVDIEQALRFACSRSRLVIVTGGLGPTDSDITREVLSKFTGIALAEHPEVLQDMEQRLNTPREKLRANLRRQTRVPTQGTYLRNAAGSAVGLVFESENSVIVALPGPPRELQPMVREELVPYLARRLGTRINGCSLTIRFVGIGQSQIDQTMKDHIHLLADVLETSQFEAGRVDFTFALPHDRPEDRARLERLRQQFHEHLDEFIYADDATTTLEDRVLGKLAAAGHTLALAEAGSGGSLAEALCHAQLAPKVVAGAFVAPSEEQLQTVLAIADEVWNGTAQTERPELLATTAARRAQSQWSVVVGAPQEDASTSQQRVTVCVHPPQGAPHISSGRWPGASATAQAGLVSELLDKLRRVLP